MDISLNTDVVFDRFGFEQGLEIFKSAGFECVDYSFFNMNKENFDEPLNREDYRETALKIRKKADSLNIRFNQAHAPFPSQKEDDEEYTRDIFKKIVRAIEISGILGVGVIVVHPLQFSDRLNHMEENLAFYKKLLPYAERAKVKIAVENMWAYDQKRGYITKSTFSYSEELAEFIKLADSEWLTVCLDVGHCCLTGREAQDEIRALKGVLGALHVHDTDYKKDLHTLCYYGNQMWDKIAEALGEIGYKNDFTFECSTFVRKVPDQLVSSGLRYMHEVGEYLVSEIEKNR